MCSTLNDLPSLLSGGDLRSDGAADQVAGIVLENLTAFEDLYQGLYATDDVVRGRTANALEKVSRSKPNLLIPHLTELAQIARQDPVPMVRWHLAIIFGSLACFKQHLPVIAKILLEMLDDRSVFVRSWVISSLCLVAQQDASSCAPIIQKIEPLLADPSVAIHARARKALNLLLDENLPFPPGWIKSEHLWHL